MLDVIAIGSATRDTFLRSEVFETHAHGGEKEVSFPLGEKIEIDDLFVETGGGASNAAVTFTHLGWKTGLIASIGADHLGDEILAHLKDYKVDTRLMQRRKGLRTGRSIIILSGAGERTILVHRGAAASFDKKRFPFAKLRAKWLYVTSLGGDIALLRRILAAAKKSGIKVAWNPGGKEIAHGMKTLSPLIRKVDVLLLNKEEAADLASIETLRPLPRRALVITDGENGTTAFDRTGAWHSGTIDVPRVNVTGAGDAFGSGFVAGLLRKDAIPYALAVGTWNATGVVQKMGAKTGIIRTYPSAAAIQKVLVTPFA